MDEFHVFVVSDGTGETAAVMAKAALLQFKPATAKIMRYGNVRSIAEVLNIVREAENRKALVIHTFATQELRQTIDDLCRSRNVPSHDLMGLLFERLEKFTGITASQQPGLLHQVDDEYFEKLDALSYAVRHDDNREPAELERADIVLVGVSRTSKTPLSMYLAQEGWFVANVPIVMGEALCPELDRIDPAKVVGLTISPERLVEVRKVRLTRLGAGDSTYADPARVREELEYCRKIFAQHVSWTVLDVTGKSVEEIASEVLDRLFGRERPV